ncbi:MAG: ROK family protein [Bacteroidales bacterium]|nr:ROK family protein [Bacteroidales bacterium]
MNIVGIDIGGTKCAVILGQTDESGHTTNLCKKGLVTRDFPDPYQMIAQMQQELKVLLASHEVAIESVASIGISCGGPLDSVTGMILSPPNLPGWDKIPIVKLFVEEFGIPTFIQNDANACALAEWLMGAGRGTSNMIFLTFGTGMGAGLILNGKLYSGTNDLGGEAGHIRLAQTGPVGFGKAGSFEGFCSGGGIAQLSKSVVIEKLKNNDPVEFCPSLDMIDRIDARMVATAAQAGDPVANEIIGISAGYLGYGLSILIDILNPECIVIGSIYARNENLFKPVMEKIIQWEALEPAARVCTIKPAELGESVGDYAALGVAVYGNKN